MIKAAREAKVHMSWINPNPDYEQALVDFVRYALTRQRKNIFVEDFIQFHKKISRLGMFNSLSQSLLKFTCPGMPDIYQGDELWNFNLVDPDNRRQVDYGKRREMLDCLRRLFAQPSGTLEGLREIMSDMEDGRIKMYLTWRVLSFRREQELLFKEGDYLKLNAEGPRAAHVCAFARTRARRLCRSYRAASFLPSDRDTGPSRRRGRLGEDGGGGAFRGGEGI